MAHPVETQGLRAAEVVRELAAVCLESVPMVAPLEALLMVAVRVLAVRVPGLALQVRDSQVRADRAATWRG